MAEAGVIIDKTMIEAASPQFRAELAAMIGLQPSVSAGDGGQSSAASKLADLDEAGARMFLAGCGAKSTRVLTLIVKQQGNFYLRELERSARAQTTGLRGVWTGLTKRTRTITGDPDAALIGWRKRGEDYEGWLSPKTCESFKAAMDI